MIQSSKAISYINLYADKIPIDLEKVGVDNPTDEETEFVKQEIISAFRGPPRSVEDAKFLVRVSFAKAADKVMEMRRNQPQPT